MTKDQMTEFYDAYNFLENHPALLGDLFSGVSSISTQVAKCCKNGFSKLDIIHVYRNDEGYEDYLGRGFREESSDLDPSFDNIWVPYKERYGEDWSFDHVEVWIEGGPHFYVKGGHYGKDWGWQRYHDYDLDSSGNTYEEAIIEFANNFKNKYGDYHSSEYEKNTVVPQWIVEHNKINKPYPKNLKDVFKNGKINRNPKNIHLSDKEINTIWWEMYREDQEFGECERIDITRYLSKENYYASE